CMSPKAPRHCGSPPLPAHWKSRHAPPPLDVTPAKAGAHRACRAPEMWRGAPNWRMWSFRGTGLVRWVGRAPWAPAFAGVTLGVWRECDGTFGGYHSPHPARFARHPPHQGEEDADRTFVARGERAMGPRLRGGDMEG